jgi:regulator of replication initiation timing
METIFQYLVDDFDDKTHLLNDLVNKVKSLSHENVSLKTKNEGLKNQLKYVEDMFHTIMNDHSIRVSTTGNTTSNLF